MCNEVSAVQGITAQVVLNAFAMHILDLQSADVSHPQFRCRVRLHDLAKVGLKATQNCLFSTRATHQQQLPFPSAKSLLNSFLYNQETARKKVW